MTRLNQVREFNALMASIRSYTYIMTLGNGSMADKPRVNGWVLYQSPRLGDERDFAKWFPNRKAAELELSTYAK
jgi:hypothetical protein